MTKQHAQKRKKKNAKFNGGVKVAIAAVSTTALIGGWNAIGHLEAAQGQGAVLDATPAVALIAPTPAPTSTPGLAFTGATITLPAIPTLEIEPIPTLALASGTGAVASPGTGGVTGVVIAPAAVSAPAMPALAPLPSLPALAPLPDLPSMPAPPPPPPSRSGGGKKSSGS